MIDINNVKQLKIADGSEIICEIMEELEEDIVVRGAFRIARVDLDSERSYYMFKPWMTYVEESDHFITINLYHLIAATVPSKDILDQYENAIEKISEAVSERNDSLDEIPEEEIKEKLSLTNDSEVDNVLKFNFIDKTKLH
jgi:hypothetical protein